MVRNELHPRVDGPSGERSIDLVGSTASRRGFARPRAWRWSGSGRERDRRGRRRARASRACVAPCRTSAPGEHVAWFWSAGHAMSTRYVRPEHGMLSDGRELVDRGPPARDRYSGCNADRPIAGDGETPRRSVAQPLLREQRSGGRAFADGRAGGCWRRARRSVEREATARPVPPGVDRHRAESFQRGTA